MKQGFSLVELSIVLAILGLLTGGIIAAQSYIRQAELKNVSIEYNRWVTATVNFRTKYGQLPGDFNNAISYWGALDADPTTCATLGATLATTPKTCNGDGDDMISLAERFRYWQHLANAGLIEGLYSGVKTASGSWAAAGENSPVSKLSGNPTWMILYGTGSSFTSTTNANVFQFGVPISSWVRDPYFSAIEAYSIDNKMDDGLPAKGFVTTYQAGNNCNTATTLTDYNAKYDTAGVYPDIPSCAFAFNAGL